LRYVPMFRNQTFVVSLDGSIIADENFPNLLLDIAVLRSLSIKIVLVHGIGMQLKSYAKNNGIPITDAYGQSVTDSTTLDAASKVVGQVGFTLLGGLTGVGLQAVISNAIKAVPVGILNGQDQLYTGKVERIDISLLTQILEQGAIPIVQPIAFDRYGHPLRLNSDFLAVEVARSLQASKLVFLTPHPNLQIDGQPQINIPVTKVRALIQQNPESIDENVRSKVFQAIRAIDGGTPRVHILDGRVFDGLLTEIFSSDGIGTMIHGNDYQQIRMAQKRDVRTLYHFLKNASNRQELVFRSYQTIEKSIDGYFIFEIDESLIGCACLLPVAGKPEWLELASLYVSPLYQKKGIGKKLVDFARMRARELGARQLLALSTQSPTFFLNNGFDLISSELLPAERRQQYNASQRNSKILLQSL
jgi:amino-acid N-acetyltransferase